MKSIYNGKTVNEFVDDLLKHEQSTEMFDRMAKQLELQADHILERFPEHQAEVFGYYAAAEVVRRYEAIMAWRHNKPLTKEVKNESVSE